MQIGYKVVSYRFGAKDRYSAVVTDRLARVYPQHKVVKPAVSACKLLAFAEKEDALKWARDAYATWAGHPEVWEAELEVSAIPVRLVFWDNDPSVKVESWKTARDYDSKDGPLGTVACDSVKLLRRIWPEEVPAV